MTGGLELMRSKLQAFCTMLLEASWLAAATILPLFFNTSSVQTFEPDKMFVLKSLVLLSGAAWLLREIIKGEWDVRQQIPSLLRKPLVAPVLSVAAIYVLSSIFSVAPILSWWGTYYEAQGTIAFLCYVVLFLIVLTELHSPAQLKRLQYVLILTSLPVSAYAILQHFGGDPFLWTNAYEKRSGGSMGNPIFLGGYLVMVIPLTLCRIIGGWKGLRNGGDRRPRFVLVGCSGIALALQLLAFFYTQSLGPLLGLAGSGYLCLFIFLVLNKGPRRKGLVFPAAAAGLGFLVPFLTLAATLAFSKFSPGSVLPRLAAVFAAVAVFYWFVWRTQWGRSWLWLTWLTQSLALIIAFAIYQAPAAVGIPGQMSSLSRIVRFSDESFKHRQALWETVVRFLRAGPQSNLPDGTHDPYYLLRPAVGYGSECSWLITNAYAVPSLVRFHFQENENRVHNETFDNLITTGYAGAGAYLWVIAAAFYYSFRYFGFASYRRGRIGFVLLSGLGILAGVLLPWAAGVPQLIGIGVEAGFLAGIFGFVAWSGFRNTQASSETNARQLFVLGILGGLTAHQIEIGGAYSVTPNSVYFYLYLALLAIGCTQDLTTQEEPAKRHKTKSLHSAASPLLPFAALSAFVIFVESWCFTFNTKGEKSAPALFVQTWFAFFSGERHGFQMPTALLLVLLTLGGTIALIYSEKLNLQISRSGFRRSILGSVAFLAAVWIGMGMLSAFFWTGLDNPTPLENSQNSEARMTVFVLGLILLLGITALILHAREVKQYREYGFRNREVLIALLLFVCTGIGIWMLTLRPAWADIASRTAQGYEAAGNPAAAAQLFERASQLASNVVQYHYWLGLAQTATAGSDPLQLETARLSFQKALALNPLDPVVYHTLGTFYAYVGEHSPNLQVRTAEIAKAMTCFQKASRLAPNYPSAYDEIGHCFSLLGEYEKAKSVLQKSLQMNPNYWRTYKYLGEMQYLQKNYEGALQSFNTAAGLNPDDPDAQKNVGALFAVLGQTDAAIRTSLEALKRAPNDSVLLTRLASWYFAIGNYSSGSDFAKRAYDATPSAGRGSFAEFKEKLQNQSKP
jgi:tetratricopeptide (TPR) repeat protein